MKKLIVSLFCFVCLLFCSNGQNITPTEAYANSNGVYTWYLPYDLDQCDSVTFICEENDSNWTLIRAFDTTVYNVNIVEIRLMNGVSYCAVMLMSINGVPVSCNDSFVVYKREE